MGWIQHIDWVVIFPKKLCINRGGTECFKRGCLSPCKPNFGNDVITTVICRESRATKPSEGTNRSDQYGTLVLSGIKRAQSPASSAFSL